MQNSNVVKDRTIRFDTGRLAIEDIVDIADGSARAVLSESPEFRAAPIFLTVC